MRIVLVEDNEMLASGISKTLHDSGNTVEAFTDGISADIHIQEKGADLAILDINLPGLDGLEITKRIRQRHQTFPVIMLTARGSLNDRIKGLDSGADDYLIKPFEMEELEARVRALSRRNETLKNTVENIGNISFHTSSRELKIDNNKISISRRELMLFEALLENRDRFISKDSLADKLYGVGSDTHMNAIELAISRLRRLIKNSRVKIHTARGIGYMLQEEE